MSGYNTDPALLARIAALELKAGIAPPYVESAPKTSVTVAYPSLAEAKTAGAVLVGQNGGQWRLVSTTTQGNQIEYTPFGGTAGPLVGQKVSELYYSTDHRIHQAAQSPPLWWDTDDVWPPAWSAIAGSTTPPAGYTPPVVTPPPPPPPGAAKRLYDAMMGWGINGFPNSQDDNGANRNNHASAASYATGLNAIYGGSGFGPLVRLYADIWGATDTINWCKTLAAAVPRCTFVLTFSAWTSAASTVSIMRGLLAAGLNVVMEGQNETNNSQNLGTSATTPAQCRQAQQAIWSAAHPLGVKVLSPTVALGINVGGATPVADWFGGELAAIQAACDEGCQHNYPNSGGSAHELMTRCLGNAKEFGKATSWDTEYHPLLYSGNNTDTTLAAWWTGLMKLGSTFDAGCPNVIWFCYHDYPVIPYRVPVGLVSNLDSNQLTPSAKLMKALFAACADTGPTASTFTPDALDITTTSGLPAGVNAQGGGHVRVMQHSDRSFRVAVTNEQDTIGGAAPVTIGFATGKTSIARQTLSPTTGAVTTAQTWAAGTKSVTFNLGVPDIQILKIVP